ncbi:MAG: DUF992 domain-containing protein [Hoeflea sp.]|nr:DUF992 domain-containing protein [Hoeflea sp.]
MIKTTRITAAAVFLATVAMGAATVPSKADSVELGMLQCAVAGGTGFVFGSSKDLTCEYTPANASAATEAYFGVINKYGIDIGVTGASVIAWAVLAPTTDYQYQPGSLAGDYRGVSAEATAAAGAGVNLLVGGSDSTISLQPLSVQAQEGVNIAVGIAEIQLRSTTN